MMCKGNEKEGYNIVDSFNWDDDKSGVKGYW